MKLRTLSLVFYAIGSICFLIGTGLAWIAGEGR